MTMGEESWLVSMAFPTLIKPVLQKLQEKHGNAGKELRGAFETMETENPGFTAEFIKKILNKADIENEVNLPELFLLLEPQNEIATRELHITRNEPVLKLMNDRADSLKKILGRIPQEIDNRKTFLETIKDIASAIRNLLVSVNESLTYVIAEDKKRNLDSKKREFVKYSKKFSLTLKDFFKDNQQKNEVFISANYLVHQTNIILLTVKNSC